VRRIDIRANVILTCALALLCVIAFLIPHHWWLFARWNLLVQGHAFAKLGDATNFVVASDIPSNVVVAKLAYEDGQCIGWINTSGFFHEHNNLNLATARKSVERLRWFQWLILGTLALWLTGWCVFAIVRFTQREEN
jgi:hypothetical protein